MTYTIEDYTNQIIRQKWAAQERIIALGIAFGMEHVDIKWGRMSPWTERFEYPSTRRLKKKLLKLAIAELEKEQ